MKKQRVKAFTIMEVSITMLLAAILIGITYTAYSIVSKSYLSFNAKNGEMATLERLDELLKKDFRNAEIVQKDSGGIAFQSPDYSIRYEFDPAYILRISTITDTFRVSTENINTTFEGQAVNEVNPSGELNRLDELQFDLLYQNKKIPYHYFKQYSSSNLIQRIPDALH